MDIKATGATDIGQKRSNNEDSFHVDNDEGIFIVCDGMGGLASGEVASQTAVAMWVEQMKTHKAEWTGWLDQAQVEPLQRFVQAVIQDICSTIYQKAEVQSDHSRMGTTLTALLVSGGKGAMIHVGDSRLYLCRNGVEHQLSQDHTLLQQLIAHGILSAEESKDHPHGNILTRSLGTQPSVLPDLLLFDVLPGDTFVLCSDGLSGYLDHPGELLEQLNQLPTDGQLQGLLALANERGGRDNITAVIVDVAAPFDAADTIEEKGIPGLGHIYNQMFSLLEESFLCKGLQLAEVMRLLNVCHHVMYPEAGVDITREGEATDSFYLILSGECQISQEGRFERTLTQGHHFGDTALFEDQVAIETVRTLSPTSLLMIKRKEFATFTRRRPRLGQKLMRNTSRELSRRWRLLKSVVAEMTRDQT